MAVGLAAGDAVGDADAEALGDAVAATDPDAEADPLGSGAMLATGSGLGDGKMALGTLANESTKMSTKMTAAPITQARARVSDWGGSAPR